MFSKDINIVESKLAMSPMFLKTIGEMDKKSSLIWLRKQQHRKQQEQKLSKLWVSQSSFDTFQSEVIHFVKDLNQVIYTIKKLCLCNWVNHC